MTRSFEAIKRKFYSPLANKQANSVQRYEETELTESLESAEISPLRSESQAPACAPTQHLIAAAKLGVNGSCKTSSPSSFSQLGKRANSSNLLKAGRQRKLQRSSLVKDPNRTVRFSGDSLEPTDDDLKHLVTLTASNEKKLLDIPLPANLRDSESSELNYVSSYQTIVVSTLAGAVRGVQEPPDQGLRLPTRKDSLHRLQSQLVPRKCRVSHEDSKAVSKQATSVILPLLQEAKAPNNQTRESPNEEYLSAEWSNVVSPEVPCMMGNAGCADVSEPKPLQSLYQDQAAEFRNIWSSKRLQMVEVAACMMQSDFQLLSIIH